MNETIATVGNGNAAYGFGQVITWVIVIAVVLFIIRRLHN